MARQIIVSCNGIPPVPPVFIHFLEEHGPGICYADLNQAEHELTLDEAVKLAADLLQMQQYIIWKGHPK